MGMVIRQSDCITYLTGCVGVGWSSDLLGWRQMFWRSWNNFLLLLWWCWFLIAKDVLNIFTCVRYMTKLSCAEGFSDWTIFSESRGQIKNANWSNAWALRRTLPWLNEWRGKNLHNSSLNLGLAPEPWWFILEYWYSLQHNMLSLEPWRFTLEHEKLSLEPWSLNLEH